MERFKRCVGTIASRPCKKRKDSAPEIPFWGREIKTHERADHPPCVGLVSCRVRPEIKSAYTFHAREPAQKIPSPFGTAPPFSPHVLSFRPTGGICSSKRELEYGTNHDCSKRHNSKPRTGTLVRVRLRRSKAKPGPPAAGFLTHSHTQNCKGCLGTFCKGCVGT